MLSRFNLYPFGKVFCVSLKHSNERRERMLRELRKNNISNYEFVDAIDKDSQIVEDAYENGKVKLFPPCFRCGKTECQCDNNVLIPSQVATFYSHMKVWELIAERKSGIYLIVEDDVKFNWYYKLIKYYVFININRCAEQNKEIPLLIRLGWAYNSEHRLQRIRFVSGLVKMSNPMYAVNPRMAKALLQNFKGVATTVDLFLHKDVAPRYANYTLIPPIACELSYSFGSVESLVRPRSKRIKELEKIKVLNDKTAKEFEDYDNHIDRAVTKRLLVIGHPCTGAACITKLLKAYGVNIENNAMAHDGIVSWMFTVFDLKNPYYLNKYAKSRYFSTFEKVIMFARDPITAIPGLIVENNSSEASYSFRAKHILRKFNVNLDDIESDLERAIESYYLWTKLSMLNRPELIVRIEKDEAKLEEYLINNDFEVCNVGDDNNVRCHIECVKKYAIESAHCSKKDWLNLDVEWRIKVNKLCALLNYKPIFDDNLSNMIRYN